MIEFIFRIKNPRPSDGKGQKDYVMWDKRLSKNWATELQISRWPKHNFIEVWLNTAWTGEDHAGPSIFVEFFGYMFNFKIYNVNHWNWDEGRFYTQEEAEEEWRQDQEWRKEHNVEADPEDKYAMWKEREQ